MFFSKLSATGNDFIVLNACQVTYDWSKLAKAMCDRHFGVGADGLLVVLPSEKAKVGVRIFNSDGSEAEICGNGLVSLAKFAIESSLVATSPEEQGHVNTQLTIETMAGVKTLEPYIVGGKVMRVRVDMGLPRFRPNEIPVLVMVDIIPIVDYSVNIGGEELLLTFISMGNPHAICFWDKPVVEFPLSEIGPMVEHHPLFPERVNFEVANVFNRRKIIARVWERGAGETLACGSGACAIGVAARLHGFIEDMVDINLPGGTLAIHWDGVGEVFLTSSAEWVFTGDWLERG